MTKRRSRAQTAERNRTAVLAAARDQFERHGYHGATLETIADAAGFSKGAVYSRFASKDDLFLAVLADHIEQRHQAIADRFDTLSGPQDLAALSDLSLRASVATVAWQAALLEFRAHAWRHPAVNARYAALHEGTIDRVASLFAGLYRKAGMEPPGATRPMAVSALASGTGVVLEYMADPELDVRRLAAAMTPSAEEIGRADRGVTA